MAVLAFLSSYKSTIVGLSALIALIAAYLWWKACVVSVPASQQKQGEHAQMWGGIMVGGPNGQSYDVIGTLIAQGRWNKLAALATGVAAALQAVALAIPSS
ncbi:hypothetical protein AKI39_03555 [Bordetella sp. H567]|uniref:hypothetical protein n=1 Tax=Bordetella sp. H567 TaxID=1697043 RepID=UPI00081CEF0A|nr:hypothetical protein [Bordetella sp. H567]AOB29959.1 hypothetical protein AKI39_03555 [Bordetella sp. H567]